MVTRVSGSANGVEISFEQKGGDRWETKVPSNLEGEYVVDLYAEDDAGNRAYACRVLFAICGHELRVSVLERGYGCDMIFDGFTAEILGGGCEGGHKVCS